MLKQCHNLIILDVESLKLRETGPASSAFCAIDAPHLKSLLYKCPRRYVDGSLHASFLTPESLIWLISNTTASLETLYIDPRPLQLEHVLQCLRLAAHVKELIIGEPFFQTSRILKTSILAAFSISNPCSYLSQSAQLNMKALLVVVRPFKTIFYCPTWNRWKQTIYM